jgi:uncharacterized protein (TIGR03067 family)
LGDVLSDLRDRVRARLRAAGRKTLQGTWTATKAGRDGKPADEVLGNRLSFSGNRFQIRSKNGNPLYEGTFRLEPSKPAAIALSIRKGP